MFRFTTAAALALTCAAVPLSAQGAADPLTALPPRSGVTAFVGVHVIPMDSERVLRDQTVIVTDGVVTAVGAASSTPVPAGARRVEARGRFLMPALADMHMHLQPGAGSLDDPAGQQLALYLAHGVTTARSLAGAPTGPQLRDRVARGEILGPRLVVYSPSLNANSVSSAAMAAGMIQAFRQGGYDGLKVHGGFDQVTYDSIIVAARREGMPVSGHVTPGYGLHHAMASGQQVEHLDGFLHALLRPDYVGPPAGQIVLNPAQLAAIDTTQIAALAAEVVRRNTWNGPTMALFETIVSDESTEQILARPDMRTVPAAARNAWAGQRQNILAAPSEQRAQYVAIRRAILRALHGAGAKLLIGPDSPQMFLTVGDAVHRELASFVDAGLSPWAALVAATRNPAEFMGWRDAGVVRSGARADLLLLDANPLENIHHTRRIAGVMVDGRWLDAERLEEMRRAVVEKVAAQD